MRNGSVRCACSTPARIASFVKKPGSGQTPARASVPTTNGSHVHGQAPQAAHAEHVVGAEHVDHRAGAEEEQRLEDAVDHQVHEAGLGRGRAGGGHHVAELRDGGVGEHALDVVLHARHARGQQRGEGADPGHQREHVGRQRKSGKARVTRKTPAVTMVAAWMSADTGVGPFHRVGQPDVQRELRRLAHRAEVDQEHDAGQGSTGSVPLVPIWNSVQKSKVPVADQSMTMPATKPRSPSLVIQNAFTAARAAAGRSYQ